jgi:hypothetical protein
MKIEMTPKQATAVRQALLLHTKDDSVSFPSNRVKLIREVIFNLDHAIEGKEPWEE